MSFIVLAHQRSGSSFFLDVLRHHPQIDTINEPFSMHLDFFRSNEETWRKTDFRPDIYHQELAIYPETISYLCELNQWLNFDYPHVRGFKETALFEKYEWIEQLVRNDHLIILIRDPRAIAYSILRRKMHTSWWNYSEKLYKYYGYSRQAVDVMTDLEICCQLIKERHNHLISLILEKKPFVVLLEEFLNNKEEILEGLMSYLGLQTAKEQFDFLIETTELTKDSTYSNSRSQYDVVERWKKFFTKKDLEIMNNVLREQLRFFNYE